MLEGIEAARRKAIRGRSVAERGVDRARFVVEVSQGGVEELAAMRRNSGPLQALLQQGLCLPAPFEPVREAGEREHRARHAAAAVDQGQYQRASSLEVALSLVEGGFLGDSGFVLGFDGPRGAVVPQRLVGVAGIALDIAGVEVCVCEPGVQV